MGRIRSMVAAATLVVASLGAALVAPAEAHVSQTRSTQGPGDFSYIYGDSGEGKVWDGECDGNKVRAGVIIYGVGEFFTTDANGCTPGGTNFEYANDAADYIRTWEHQDATLFTPAHWAPGAVVKVHKHAGNARVHGALLRFMTPAVLR